jgi:hypothetical protein
MDVRFAPLAEAENAARNLMNSMRAPIESLSVPERLNRYYTAQEEAENREAEAARYQREAEREAWAMQQEARQRIQRYVRGYTDEELAQQESERQQFKQARITELEEQLRRLRGEPDPDKKVTRSATAFTTEPVESLLARAKAAGDNPFMRRQVEMFDLQREAARSRQAQAEISRLEQAVNGGTVTRRCDTGFTTY